MDVSKIEIDISDTMGIEAYEDSAYAAGCSSNPGASGTCGLAMNC